VWTLKHGHFLIMGGIRLVEEATAPGVPPTTSTSPVESTLLDTSFLTRRRPNEEGSPVSTR